MLYEYESKHTLNPALWNDDRLVPGLRKKFLKIARAFIEFLEVSADVKDIILIGSNANYNWTEHSDIDLHVVIDYSSVQADPIVLNNYMLAKKSIWNLTYPLSYRGMTIELFAQDHTQTLHPSVGVFSLLKNKWLNKPSAQMISIDDDLIKQKVKPYQLEIDNLSPENPKILSQIKNLTTRLKRLRQTGLDASGEYSIENLAYKQLRNTGYLQKIKSLAREIQLGRLTIETPLNENDATLLSIDDITESLIGHVTGKRVLQRPDWKRIMHSTNAVMHPEGQWKFPGKCTMIPTTNGTITMQRVKYPVLGIDNTGYMQMMKPEQQYQFPGKMVFEIPHTAQWQTMIIQLQNAVRNGTKYK